MHANAGQGNDFVRSEGEQEKLGTVIGIDLGTCGCLVAIRFGGNVIIRKGGLGNVRWLEELGSVWYGIRMGEAEMVTCVVW